jgi:hypothetical protein
MVLVVVNIKNMWKLLCKIWSLFKNIPAIDWILRILGVRSLIVGIIISLAGRIFTYVKSCPWWVSDIFVFFISFFGLCLILLLLGHIMEKRGDKLKIDENNSIKIGYADFIKLGKVSDPRNWEQGFIIKTDGVWIDPPKEDADATKGERAVLTYHHLKDLSKPALPFPCSFKEFNRFIEDYGMAGYFDQYYLESLKIKEQNKLSPLEIIFDPANPARRFWSMESSEQGVFWEYRVEIVNHSSKTLRNVSLTTEHLGQMGRRPVDQKFDKFKQVSCDLKPGCSELVRIVPWPIPKIQAGMLASSSALEYGPIKVTASADDVLPSMRLFQFDYQQTPMIFDHDLL